MLILASILLQRKYLFLNSLGNKSLMLFEPKSVKFVPQTLQNSEAQFS
jgi:hypothetical protein